METSSLVLHSHIRLRPRENVPYSNMYETTDCDSYQQVYKKQIDRFEGGRMTGEGWLIFGKWQQFLLEPTVMY